jgi:hypothetical protein
MRDLHIVPTVAPDQPFVQVGYGLYFFGLQDYTTSVWFYDLNQRSFTVGRKAHTIDTWLVENGFRNRSRRSPLTVYVETTVLLLVDWDGHLEILRII